MAEYRESSGGTATMPPALTGRCMAPAEADPDVGATVSPIGRGTEPAEVRETFSADAGRTGIGRLTPSGVPGDGPRRCEFGPCGVRGTARIAALILFDAEGPVVLPGKDPRECDCRAPLSRAEPRGPGIV